MCKNHLHTYLTNQIIIIILIIITIITINIVSCLLKLAIFATIYFSIYRATIYIVSNCLSLANSCALPKFTFTSSSLKHRLLHWATRFVFYDGYRHPCVENICYEHKRLCLVTRKWPFQWLFSVLIVIEPRRSTPIWPSKLIFPAEQNGQDIIIGRIPCN